MDCAVKVVTMHTLVYIIIPVKYDKNNDFTSAKVSHQAPLEHNDLEPDHLEREQTCCEPHIGITIIAEMITILVMCC